MGVFFFLLMLGTKDPPFVLISHDFFSFSLLAFFWTTLNFETIKVWNISESASKIDTVGTVYFFHFFYHNLFLWSTISIGTKKGLNLGRKIFIAHLVYQSYDPKAGRSILANITKLLIRTLVNICIYKKPVFIFVLEQ